MTCFLPSTSLTTPTPQPNSSQSSWKHADTSVSKSTTTPQRTLVNYSDYKMDRLLCSPWRSQEGGGATEVVANLKVKQNNIKVLIKEGPPLLIRPLDDQKVVGDLPHPFLAFHAAVAILSSLLDWPPYFVRLAHH